MANRMNRMELENALAAAGLDIPEQLDEARLRDLFLQNRQHIEQIVGVNLDETEVNAAEQTICEHTVQPIDAVENRNVHSSQPQKSNAESDELERELYDVRRQHEILRLKREIEQMQRGEAFDVISAAPTAMISSGATMAHTSVRKIHFQDIEHAIVKFSGEDRTYSASDFFRHLEQIFEQVNADDLLKFLTLRNSLTGAARLLLTRGALTYKDLKASLLKEFGRSISRQEVYQTLRSRCKKTTESVRRYIMEMESIAHRSDVTSFELVVFIQEGLHNRTSDFALFATAKSMEDLKDAVNIFEQRQAMRGGEPKQDATATKPNMRTQQQQQNINPAVTGMEDDRCFNCSRKGHRKPSCPFERRVLQLLEAWA